MVKLFGFLAGIGVIVVLVAAILGQAIPREPSYLELAQQQVRAERLYQEAEIEAFWAPIRAAWLNLSLMVGGAGVALYLAALGVSQLAFFRRYAHPDERGLLPILRDDQDAARGALDDHHQTERTRASIGPVPHSYAPHITHQLDYRADRPGIPGDVALVEPAKLPGVIDLAQISHVPTREAILLGLADSGTPIIVPAARLCHVALVGSTGGGKSNLLRLLLPQLLTIGADLVLADPHFAPLDPENGDDWRPIADRLMLPPAVSAAEIDSLLAYLVEALDRRLALRREGLAWGPPLFLALDELPVIADSVPNAIERIARVLREGRKVGMYSVGSAQTMLVKVLGGDSSARENFRTAFYVGGDIRSATALLDVPQRDVNEGALAPGLAYLRSAATSPARLVRVPYASNAGIAAILGDATGPVSGPTTRPLGFRPASTGRAEMDERPGRGPVSGPDGASASGRAKTPFDTDEARLLAKFAAGASIHDLAVELAGTSNPGDRRYKAARAKVEALLRRLTEGTV
jgi:hypothetical protein